MIPHPGRAELCAGPTIRFVAKVRHAYEYVKFGHLLLLEGTHIVADVDLMTLRTRSLSRYQSARIYVNQNWPFVQYIALTGDKEIQFSVVLRPKPLVERLDSSPKAFICFIVGSNGNPVNMYYVARHGVVIDSRLQHAKA